MNLLVIIISVIAVPVIIWQTLTVVSIIIANHNIRKYGHWWGNLPRWAEKMVDYFD